MIFKKAHDNGCCAIAMDAEACHHYGEPPSPSWWIARCYVWAFIHKSCSMTEFTVLNMQTEATTGWAARAMQRGLRTSSASGRFGDELYLVKDGSGNIVQLTQNTQRARKLDTKGFSVGQDAIVQVLHECGLVRPFK